MANDDKLREGDAEDLPRVEHSAESADQANESSGETPPSAPKPPYPDIPQELIDDAFAGDEEITKNSALMQLVHTLLPYVERMVFEIMTEKSAERTTAPTTRQIKESFSELIDKRDRNRSDQDLPAEVVEQARLALNSALLSTGHDIGRQWKLRFPDVKTAEALALQWIRVMVNKRQNARRKQLRLSRQTNAGEAAAGRSSLIESLADAGSQHAGPDAHALGKELQEIARHLSDGEYGTFTPSEIRIVLLHLAEYPNEAIVELMRHYDPTRFQCTLARVEEVVARFRAALARLERNVREREADAIASPAAD